MTTIAHRAGAGGQRRQHPRSKAGDGLWLRDYGAPIPGLDPTGGPSLFALSRPGWKDPGLCVDAGDGEQAWFSEPGTLKASHAAQICAGCPVREMCLAAALVFVEEFGIWGGLDPAERRPFVNRLQDGEPLGAVLADALHKSAREAAA